MLVDARRKNVRRNHTGTPECDSVSSDVEKDVSRLKNDTSESVGLFVCYEREPRVVEATVEDVLAAHKSEANACRQIGVCSSLWRRTRADLGCDIGE